MKHLRSSLTAATLSFALVASGNAQTTATTDPVGFLSYLVKANSDQKIGVPMQQASAFQGAATTVSGNSVTASGLTSLTGSYFLVVTSGSANGQWESVSSSASGSLTLAVAISGFAAGNTFEVKPFWTLATLLPNGGNLPASPDVFDPVGQVLVNNPAATGVNLASSGAYFYHSPGDADYPAGWYDASNIDAGLANNVVLTPECSMTLRNPSASQVTVSFVGSVPDSKFALDIVSRSAGAQDNLVYNKFPSDTTLNTSSLVSSGAVSPSVDVFDPGDQVLLYSLANNGANPSASAAYFYYVGDADYPAGWYDSSNVDGGSANNVTLPAGVAVTIRKARTVSNTSVSWNPSVPYSLQ